MKLLLSTICIALLALFAYQVMSYPLDANDSQKLKLDKELSKSLEYDLPQLSVLNGIDEYAEIVQRPLFAKDRAAAIKANKQTVNKVSTINDLSHLILVGTARSTDVQIAIVADTKAKQIERLRAGEPYKDWNITVVATDHIVFQNDELEHKLYVTPIEGSQKAKQAKLISQLNKSKIERATEKIKSYKKLEDNTKTSTSSSKTPEKKVASGIWSYRNKPSPSAADNSIDKKANHNKAGTATSSKPAKRSPIKIPHEEEKDAAYYEGEDVSDGDSSTATNRKKVARELTAEDYYDDEDITEDELKALEGLGAQIFDD